MSTGFLRIPFFTLTVFRNDSDHLIKVIVINFDAVCIKMFIFDNFDCLCFDRFNQWFCLHFKIVCLDAFQYNVFVCAEDSRSNFLSSYNSILLYFIHFFSFIYKRFVLCNNYNVHDAFHFLRFPVSLQCRFRRLDTEYQEQ